MRSRAKVTVAFAEDDHFILVFSSLLMRRGKNFRLAKEVETMLLASGAKVYGQPVSTNLVYRVDTRPDVIWLNRLNSAAITVLFMHNADQGAAEYPSGEFTSASRGIRFSTGPAIEPQTMHSVYFVGLEADVADIANPNSDPFLKSLDAALRRNGAKRLEVQLEMDVLK